MYKRQVQLVRTALEEAEKAFIILVHIEVAQLADDAAEQLANLCLLYTSYIRDGRSEKQENRLSAC